MSSRFRLFSPGMNGIDKFIAARKLSSVSGNRTLAVGCLMDSISPDDHGEISLNILKTKYQ